MKQFNLCFVGFGNVGRALVRLLVRKRPEMREKFGIDWRITGIATRRFGWIAAPDGLEPEAILAGTSPSPTIQITNVRAWLEHARADVLFETTSLNPFTGQPAIDHIRAALESGAHAITANKGPIVHAFDDLTILANAQQKRFMFESTVADCLPIFSLFRETLPAVRLLGFSGIFNSTTSIILEEMEAGSTFEEGVKRAQEMGVAETDPSYDVDGWDAAVKVCALARVLMNAPLKLDDIEREGISGLSKEMVCEARAAGKPFKLVSRASLSDKGGESRVIASVRPEQLANTDPLATLTGSSLMAHFELDVLPGLTLTAHRPNLESTAYGMLADFINAVK